MLETSAKLAVLPEAVERLSTRQHIHVSRSLHGALAGTRTLKPLRAMSLSHACIPIPAQEQVATARTGYLDLYQDMLLVAQTVLRWHKIISEVIGPFFHVRYTSQQ